MKNIFHFLAIFIFLAVIAVSTGGILFMSGTSMEGSGEMSGCLFMKGDMSLCGMKGIDHITAWKNTFVSMTIILTTLAAIVVLVGRHDTSDWDRGRYEREKDYLDKQRELVISDFLNKLTRDGLLRPQIY